MKFKKSSPLKLLSANLNQTLLKWSLGGPLPKMCLTFQTSDQDGHHSLVNLVCRLFWVNSWLPLQFSLLWNFVLFVLVLCLLFPMLPVSLDCQFLIAPTVFFVVEFVLFVLVLCLLFPMLSVSLDCRFLIAPTVFFVVEFVLFVVVLCLLFPMLPVSLDCQFLIYNLETLATWETKDIRRGQTKQIPQQRKL
jgi:hypothetical protein